MYARLSILITLTVSSENMPSKILNTLLPKSTTKELFKTYVFVFKKNYDFTSMLAITRFNTFKQNLAKAQKSGSVEIEFNESFDLSEQDETMKVYADPKLVNINPTPSTAGKKDFAPLTWTTHPCYVKQPYASKGSMSTTLAVAAAVSVAACLRNKNTPTTLSMQQLNDCSTSMTNFPSAYEYYIYNTGLFTASTYPYVAQKAGTCKDSSYSGAVKNYSWEYSPYMFTGMALDTATIYSALTRGPILVGFNFYSGLSNYTSGILTPTSTTGSCSYYWWGLVVGYGTSSTGADYWIVHGYSGSTWGISGTFWLARNDTALNYGISCGYSRPQ